MHGGTDGFRVFRDVAHTGGGICNSCGAFADGFALLRWLTGWTFPVALEAVGVSLGLTERPDRQPIRSVGVDPVVKTERSVAVCRQALCSTWIASLAPTDPAAWPLWRYLEHRGVGSSLAWLDPRVVRFHPHLAYYENGRTTGHYPAMLARVSDPHGKAVTLHRTYLHRNGAWKATVPSPKKLMPPVASMTGGAIHLASVDTEMGVAEGIETALAARCLSGQPVWAAVSATLLEKFEPPAGVRQVTIWADRDRSETGEKAAVTLQERLRRSGVEAHIQLPNRAILNGRKGVDWADVLQSTPPPSQAA
jgi:hypothetical protein